MPLELDDVIVAWAAILPELPVATRSSVQEAQPVEVEGDVITFGVPPRLFEAASPRFRREADTIRMALSERLGRRTRFTLVAHEEFTGASAAAAPPSRAGRPVPSEPSPPPPPERDPDAPAAVDPKGDETDIDPSDLVDVAPDDNASDSMQMLAENLGATVVEERRREDERRG